MGKLSLQETRLDDVRIPGVSVSVTQPKTGLDTAEQRDEQSLAVRRQKEREWAEEKKRRDLEAAAERQRQLEQERQERQRRQEEERQERERQRQLKAAEAQREKQRREQERMWDDAITKALDETEEREPWRELGYIPPEDKASPSETNLRRNFRTLEQEDSGGTGTPRPSAYDAARNALDSRTVGSGTGKNGKTVNPESIPFHSGGQPGIQREAEAGHIRRGQQDAPGGPLRRREHGRFKRPAEEPGKSDPIAESKDPGPFRRISVR